MSASPPNLTKGQAAFLKAVRESAGGIFHKRVIEPVEAMGLVQWIGGMRLIGCNSFSADNFILTDQEPLDPMRGVEFPFAANH